MDIDENHATADNFYMVTFFTRRTKEPWETYAQTRL